MMKVVFGALALLVAAAPASAAVGVPGSIVVAQDATGGPVGGPNQAQAVVPSGATGGTSGGPNQAQAPVPSGATGGRSGGPNQAQYKHHSKKKKHRHH